MIKKVAIATVILSFACIFLHSYVYCWGFFAHRKINHIAVFTLPSPLIGFYKQHIQFVSDHATDPDKRRSVIENEAPKHYLDYDHYDNTKSRDIMPKYWSDAKEKYTEDTLWAYGVLPWNLEWTYKKLVSAFEEKNTDYILKYSADIGHYIGDACVPLHTTENYNGQLTNQKGIHGFWESRLPELLSDNYDFFTGKARYIEDPLAYFWDLVYSSHSYVDSVLIIERRLTQAFPSDQKYSFETRGTQNVRTYSKPFSEAYHTALNGMVEDRMRLAIVSVGSVWYSAWVDAGKPEINDISNKELSNAYKEEIEAFEKTYQNAATIKGRSHEH